MPAPEDFDETFATLRGLLARHARNLLVQVDAPGNYQVASPTMTDRSGRPLFVAAVQVKKHYVSYHLMPIYASPGLLERISPDLKRRMQGKSCFNFRTIAPAQAKELSALTRSGIAAMGKIALPWAARPKPRRAAGRLDGARKARR